MIDFRKVIDDYLISKRDVRGRNFYEFFPSDLTFPCHRNIYYRYIHQDIPESPESLRVFKIGTLIHEFIQKVFQNETEEFIPVDIEVAVRRYYIVDGVRIRLRGRADIVVDVDGELYLIELKSMKPQYFYDYKKRKMVRDQPFRFLKTVKPEHKQQIQWYMDNLRIKYGYVIYYEKVALEDKWFKIDLEDYKLSTGIVPVAKKIYRCLRDNKMPPPERKHWKGLICNFCKFKEMCENE